MAKAGRLSSKLRSVLKKMNSIGSSRKHQSQNLSRESSIASSSSSGDFMEQTSQQSTVYVGKSRREYQVPTELLDHPVIRELATHNDEGSLIGCEVVLFEHLCWVLQQNAANQIQPIDDLAAFYAY